MINFDGKVVLITGGTRGIGKAAALIFAQAGADVAMIYRSNNSAAEETVEEIKRNNVKAVALSGDISDEKNVKNLIKAVKKEFGQIDVLVNNAGIWKYAPIIDMSDSQLTEMMDINIKSYFYFIKHTLPVMPKGGNIINVSSTAGQRGEAGHSHYAASKGAIISLTKSLAPELARDGIRVNCVAPGWVFTDMTKEAFDSEEKESIFKAIPLGQPGYPEEIAGPIVFLASEMASHITGEILNVNGGSVLCG